MRSDQSLLLLHIEHDILELDQLPVNLKAPLPYKAKRGGCGQKWSAYSDETRVQGTSDDGQFTKGDNNVHVPVSSVATR